MEQFETPKTLKKRKFPGPAGLLMSTLSDNPPKCARTDGILHGNQHSPVSHNVDSKSMPLDLSQTDTDHFTSPAWRALLDDLGTEADQVTQRFCIRSMLLKAKRKILPKGKVPLIMGVVESLDMQGMDGSVELRDPSGQMQGSLHRDLFKDSLTLLQVGCVLVLRQVSVISPSPRTHYLNITPWNLVLVYSPPRDGEGREGVHKYSPRKESESSHRGSFNTTLHRAGSISLDHHTFSEESSPLPSLTDIITESEKELIASPVPNFVRGMGDSPQFQPSSPMFGHSSNTNQSTVFKSPLYSNRNNTSLHTSNASPTTPRSPFSPAGSTTSKYSFNPSPNFTSSSATTNLSYGNCNSTKNMNSSRQTFPSRVPQTTSLRVSNQLVPSGGSESCFDNDDDDLLLLCSVNNHNTDDDDDDEDNHSKHDKSLDIVNNENSLILPERSLTPESYRDLANKNSNGASFKFKSVVTSPSLISSSSSITQSHNISPVSKDQDMELSNQINSRIQNNSLFSSPKGVTVSSTTEQNNYQSHSHTKEGRIRNQSPEKDSRIELRPGFEVSTVVPVAKSSTDDFWDNDISDELLSQLTEDF